MDVSTNKLKVKNSTFQPLLTVNQNSPLYLDASSNPKIKTDSSLTFTTNPTAGNSGTLSITNPNLWVKPGTFLYYNDVSSNIGIGKTNPAYTLDISGNINFTGNLTKNGAAFGGTTDLSGYLTSATASTTYQTQSGMSTYLTSATASNTYQTKLAINQNSPLYTDASSNVKINIDNSLAFTPNATSGNSGTLSITNPNLWVKSGTYFYYDIVL